MDTNAKNKIFLVLAIATALVTASGCDLLRSLAGRPTSRDIQRKAELIQKELDAKQASIDSLKLQQKRLADSLALMDSLKQLKGTMLNPTRMGGLYTTSLDFKYYIVIGAFMQRSNAEGLLRKVDAQGYKGTIINFRNGYNAVGISPSNSLQNVYDVLKVVREKDFCPEDVWILVNE